MVGYAIGRAKALTARTELPGRFAVLWRALIADQRGNTSIDYALTAAGIVLGGSVAVLMMGLEIGNIFHEVEFALCVQVQQFCILR